MSNELTEKARAVEFRFLPAIRAGMTNDCPAILPRSRKKKRNRLRRAVGRITQRFIQAILAMQNRGRSMPARRHRSSPHEAEGSPR